MDDFAQVLAVIFVGAVLLCSLVVLNNHLYIRAGYKKTVIPGCMEAQWLIPSATEGLSKTVDIQQ